MKSLLISLALISLCSCGRSSSPVAEGQSGQNDLTAESSNGFISPQLNVQRNLTIDKDVKSLYEHLTINSKNDGTILGDEAFYIMVDEEVYPSRDEVSLGFYNKTNVKSIFYIDSKKTLLGVGDLTKNNLKLFNLKEMTNLSRKGLIWGKHDLDYSENDMLDKAYVIKTEEVSRQGRLEFKSLSTYVVWFECLGTFRTVTDVAYSCSKYDLKFHYKIIDYSLNSIKI